MDWDLLGNCSDGLAGSEPLEIPYRCLDGCWEHTHIPNFWRLAVCSLLALDCFSTYDQLTLNGLQKAFSLVWYLIRICRKLILDVVLSDLTSSLLWDNLPTKTKIRALNLRPGKFLLLKFGKSLAAFQVSRVLAKLMEKGQKTTPTGPVIKDSCEN